VALAPGCLATHVTVPAGLVAPIPDTLPWASAAGLPIALLSARLALLEIAHLRAGQVVLIHSAAGGVGLAAVAIARAAGAVVVGSAGSAGKRALLKALGAAAVADSRDPGSYAAAVDEATGGRGVDVVLNALSGDAIAASLDLLAPGGVFIELGKRGIWSAEAVAARRGDVRYAVVDLLALTSAEPARVGQWLRELVGDVTDGTLPALPVRTFALGEAGSAFRTLAAGQHVGKFVLVPPPAVDKPLVVGDGSYLLTGGRGALGLAAAEWLVAQGAKHIALLSRSAPDETQSAVIERLRADGADVLVLQADVGDAAQVEPALNQMRQAMPPVRGVLHAAGVVRDGLLARQAWADIAQVLNPKVTGAWALQAALGDMELDWWISCSSAAGLVGQTGQAAYAAANAVLDARAQQQRAIGLAAMSVNWGPISGAGMAARAGKGVPGALAAAGVQAVPLGAIGPTLAAAWAQGQAQLAAIAWRPRAGSASSTISPPILSQLIGAAPTARRVDGATPGDGSLTQALLQASDRQRNEILLRTLRDITAELLELPSGEAVAPERPLRDLGLDSLLAVELRNRLARLLGRPLPATLLFDYPTLARLTAHLLIDVLALDAAAPAEPAEPRPSAVASTEPIAIVGLGCRFPGGADSPDAFWRLLRDGVDAISEVPADRWDVDAYHDPDPEGSGKMASRYGAFLDAVDQFDAAFFGIAPREAMAMDPQQRLLLEVAWEALERAGVAPGSLAGSLTGVFVGLSTTDYAQLQMAAGQADDIDIYFGTGSAVSVAAGRLSYVLGLQGPSMAIDTACSSALVAVHLACQSLRAGESDLALAGGVNVMLSPEASITFSRARMLAADGRCKTFDARADGYVRGEGCGVVVLKRLADAQRDGDPIWAVVRGSAVNQDGRSNGLTAPNGPAQAAVIRTALVQAGVAPNAIGYVEAHGTGTALGDPIEVQALAAVLGAGRPAEQPLLVGSVKTNVGHLEAAAGMAGLIKTVLALQHQTIPAHLHFETPSPHIAWADLPVAIPTQTRPWPSAAGARVAGVSAFGLSGTNAHVVLEEAPEPIPAGDSRPEAEPSSADRPRHLLSLSARSPAALRQMASRWADFLAANPNVSLADVCYTAGAVRTHFDHRLALAVDTPASARENLAAFAQGEAAADLWYGQPGEGKTLRVAFLFTGQGAQLAGLGRQLYATQPTFRRALDRCAGALSGLLDQPLLDLLYGSPETTALLAQTRYAQPVLFALEWALAELWQAWGVAPRALLGHSLGEYVAACQAGVFSLEDGLRLVVARGQMMETTGSGAMLAVFASPERVAKALAEHADAVSIAAMNGPSETIVAGQRNAVEAIRQALGAAGISCRALPVNYAFHSPLLDPVLNTLAEAAADVNYQPPQLTVVTNLTGAAAVDGDLTTAAYWRRQAREPVLFGQGMETLRAMGYALFVEVGPQSTLLRLGQRLSGAENALWLPTLDPERDDWSQLLESLGRLYAAGVAVDWLAFDRDYRRSRLVLPTYPFQRERYWFKHKPPLPAPSQPIRRSLLGRRLSSPVMKEVVFEAVNSADSPAFLADHRIGTTVVMPGAGYAVMMLEAARQAFHSSEIDLTEMLFTEALLLPDGQARTTQVIVTPDGAGSAALQIYSRPDDSPDDSPWTLHARATAGPLEPGVSAAEALSAESIAARCEQALAGADFYALAGERGMNFGPHFRWIEQIRRGTDEALGYLRPARPIDALDGCPIHPGLVDACFQLLAAAAPAGPDQSVALPVGFGRLRLHNPVQEPQWGYAQLTMVDQPDQHLIVGDVRLFGSLGPVLTLEGLRIRHVPRRTLIAETARPDWLYELAWTPAERTAASPAAVAPAGTWLILADQSGCAEKLERLLGVHGQRSVLILPGDSCRAEGDRRWRVDPGRREDFAHVLRAALPEGETWRGALHLWGLGAAAAEPDTISTTQELICASALHLTQALAATNGTPRLWLVTAGAQSLDAAPESGAPVPAALWGFGRTLAVEQPELWGGLIDLDPREPDSYAVNVVNELLAPDAERQVAFRRGQRYAVRLERQAAKDQATPSVPLRLSAAGTYLITGGLGSLGLKLARRLAERGARHLVLVGRNDPTESARAVIKSIEAMGVQVLVLRADVGQEREVAAVLAQISQALPPLLGIVHAAGVLDDGVLSKQTWARFASVLRPKLAGAWNLHSLTRAIPLDFFVLFSSAAALLGSPGQASYAAANAFLDSLAHRRRALGVPALSINWGPWAGEGMAGHTDTARRWAAVGLSPIDPDQGLDTFEALLQQPALVEVGVLPVNWPQFSRQFPGGSTPLLAAFLRPGGEQEETANDTERQAFLNRLLATTPERRLDLLAAHVREQVLAVLKMAPSFPLNLSQGLFELGMDSLTALEVRNHLQQSLGLPLPATVVFEHSTIRDLAQYLNEALAPAHATAAAPAAADDSNAELARLLAEIEGLSEREVDQALAGLADEQFPDGHSA
jgi:myxalamid-type polyketide synthase MxaC